MVVLAAVTTLPLTPATADDQGSGVPVGYSPAQEKRAENNPLQAKKDQIADYLSRIRSNQVGYNDVRPALGRLLGQIDGSHRSHALARLDAEYGNRSQISTGFKSLYVTQQPEQKSYYCGPSSVWTVLDYLGPYTSVDHGYSLSQAHLASSYYLKTDSTGQTSWSPGVVAPTLNHWRGITYYAAKSAPNASTFNSNVSSDIDVGYPVPINIQEPNSSGQWMVGHPHRTIYHWIGAYGYNGTTKYVYDPAAGSAALPDYSGAQAYDYYSDAFLVGMWHGVYGIIW